MTFNNNQTITAPTANKTAATNRNNSSNTSPLPRKPDMFGNMPLDQKKRLIDSQGPKVLIEYTTQCQAASILVPRRMLVKFSIFAAQNLSRLHHAQVKVQIRPGSSSATQVTPTLQLPLTALRLQCSDPSRPALQLPPQQAVASVPQSSSPPQIVRLVSPVDSVWRQSLLDVIQWMEDTCETGDGMPFQATHELIYDVCTLQVIMTLGIRYSENYYKLAIKSYINDNYLTADEVSTIWEELKGRAKDVIANLVHKLAWDAFYYEHDWEASDEVIDHVDRTPDLKSHMHLAYQGVKVASGQKAVREKRKNDRAEAGRRATRRQQ